MSGVKYLKLKGPVSWAFIGEKNYDTYGTSKHWKLNVYLDKAQADKLKASGSQVRMKHDDGEKTGIEGRYWTFRREVERDFGKGKGIETLTPVEVTFDGKPFDGLVAHGSVCEIEVELYPTRNWGFGTRLRKVNIIDLIEYIPEDKVEDLTESEVETSELDDEIPFEEAPAVSEPKPAKSVQTSKSGVRKIDW